MKKEDLVAKVAQLAQSLKEEQEADLVRRKGLTKMLRAPSVTVTGSYAFNSRTEETVYLWPEIYFALGRLDARRDYADVHQDMQQIDRRLINLETQLPSKQS